MRKILFVIFVLSLSACAKNVIPNVEICADAGQFGAFCKFTRSGNSRNIEKPQWDMDRVGQFCMTPEGIGKYQKFIETACNHDRNCVDEANKAIELLRRMNIRVAKLLPQYQIQRIPAPKKTQRVSKNDN